ncbi:uncharacterized protein [Venturia canescens]|uniref:uncharacterized protein n=1 Tax=Venturia canescens TaxID=32260 RepID=UPI001C9D2D3C|nr:uncharacterized protein LOC122414696 [Venturia canescens]
MDKLKAIMVKYPVSCEEFNHSFTSSFQHIEESLKKQEDHLFESQMKLQQLKSEVDEIENSISSEKELLDSKLQELSTAEERVHELKLDKDTLSKDVRDLEIERNSIRNAKPNHKDQQTIDYGLKKLKYYRKLTGIVWDYSAPIEVAKGYTTNEVDYVHSFNYHKKEHGRNLVELLWEEIRKAAEGRQRQQGIEESEILDD